MTLLVFTGKNVSFDGHNGDVIVVIIINAKLLFHSLLLVSQTFHISE